MDERLKRNNRAGRESRALDDAQREAPEEKFVSAQERRRTFRSEWIQEALPSPPKIPGFHSCWLSSNNQYDPIHKRMRLGYEPVKPEEVKGFEHLVVKAGEHAGFVAVNEMLLFKIPLDVYQEYMEEVHHYAPMEEQDKIKVQQDMLQQQARDSSGKPLIQVEGNGMNFNQSVQAPVFS